MKRVIVLGVGGTCIDIAEAVLALGRVGFDIELAGFLDDNPNLTASVIGRPVLGPLHAAKEFSDHYFVNGIGSAANHWKRGTILARLGVPDDRYISIVDPSARVSPSAVLGPGSVVLPGALVGSSAHLGAHTTILHGAIVSHDTIVSKYSIVAGGAVLSGRVRIGTGCYVGANASVKNDVSIGDRSMVGMGTVVISDVLADSVVVGSPARLLRTRTEPTDPGQ